MESIDWDDRVIVAVVINTNIVVENVDTKNSKIT